MSKKTNVLLVGGTGVISGDIAALAAQQEHINLYLLNRGKTPRFFSGNITSIQADVNNPEETREKIKGLHFDVVADFISYGTDALNNKLDIFRGICEQYVFVSSVAAYRPPRHGKLITEDNTPVGNFLWSYGLNKTLCEQRLQEEFLNSGMHYTIVRPAYTYNNIRILHPYTINHWRSWTIADRLLKGKPYVLHDDGQQLCTVTHSSDFAKAFIALWGNPNAINEDFHITSSQFITWKRIAELTADALGVTPDFRFVPAEKMCLELEHSAAEKVIHTCSHAIFDNSKIKQAAPDFTCDVDIETGVRRTIQFYMDNPEYKKIDEEWDNAFDRIVEKYG